MVDILIKCALTKNSLDEGNNSTGTTHKHKADLALLSLVPSFQISTTLGRSKNFADWPKLLRWWLAKNTLRAQPDPNKITIWYDFVAKNFIYRGAWGLGSVIGLLLEGAEGEEPIRALEIGDWPRSGLPWIAFWMKELITWGTLDPVAAFLLARGDAIARPQAIPYAWVQNNMTPFPGDIDIQNAELSPLTPSLRYDYVWSRLGKNW